MKPDQIIIIASFGLMFIQMIGFGIYFKKNKWSMAGTPPINKLLFKTGKASMMLVWCALFVESTGLVRLTFYDRTLPTTIPALIFLLAGAVLQLAAYFQLGHNLKFGIPTRDEENETTLKTTGLYRFSRNPMYVGFFMLLLSTCFYVLNPVIWILSIYACFVHHLIVLKEEHFLEKKFGADWYTFTIKVRRYL